MSVYFTKHSRMDGVCEDENAIFDWFIIKCSMFTHQLKFWLFEVSIHQTQEFCKQSRTMRKLAIAFFEISVITIYLKLGSEFELD
jgi:hypothetical protein